MSSLQLNHICKLTAAMIDKSSSGFNLCRHEKYSLPSTLILFRLCEDLLSISTSFASDSRDCSYSEFR